MAYRKVATIKIERDGGTVHRLNMETEGTVEHILGFLMTQGRDIEAFLKTNDGTIVITMGVKRVPVEARGE